jgi:hypothetical protein
MIHDHHPQVPNAILIPGYAIGPIIIKKLTSSPYPNPYPNPNISVHSFIVICSQRKKKQTLQRKPPNPADLGNPQPMDGHDGHRCVRKFGQKCRFHVKGLKGRSQRRAAVSGLGIGIERQYEKGRLGGNERAKRGERAPIPTATAFLPPPSAPPLPSKRPSFRSIRRASQGFCVSYRALSLSVSEFAFGLDYRLQTRCVYK